MKIRMPVKAQRPILSIGMIVKNEEKNLEKCLEGLKPLLDAVPSELIIADTGSTDRTWEIAERYADQLFHFEWIDDFAAARNSTLERSSGIWYMYVDADEWFQDCDDLIAFFTNPEENRNYNSATYIQRNYVDMEKTDYSDYHVSRIFRREKHAVFRLKVHEYLPRRTPTKHLGSVVEHFGYVENSDPGKRKSNRNLPILLGMLEEADEEEISHICYQIGREYGSMNDFDQASAYNRKGIKALQPGQISERCALYHDLVMSQVFAGKWDDAIVTAQEYLKGNQAEYTADIDIRYFLSNAFYAKGDVVGQQEQLWEYIRLLGLRDTGKLDLADLTVTSVVRDNKKYRNTALMFCAGAIMQEQPEEALDLLQKIQGWDGIELPQYAKLEYICVTGTSNWAHYARCYEVSTRNKKYRPFYLSYILKLLDEVPEARPVLIQSFSKLYSDQDPDIQRILLRAGDPEAEKRFADTFQSAPASIGTSWMLYEAMKRGMKISTFVDQIDSDTMAEWMGAFTVEKDAGQVISDYYAGKGPEQSLRSIRWKCALMEHILLTADPENEVHRRNFASYCEAVIAYVTRLYGTEMPDAEVFGILPHAHRFAYHMRDALAQLDQGETTEALHSLLAAGKAYPYLLRFVQQMIQEYGQASKIRGRRMEGEQEEAEMLTKEIKRSIRDLIMTGDQENASQLLKRYASIRPDDVEIAVLYQELEQPALQS